VIAIRPLMGTVFRLTVPDGTPDAVIAEAFDWWRSVEEQFSTFRDDSEISRIGRGELAVDDASIDVRHVLARCMELEEATGGRFSIRPGRQGGPGLDPAGLVKGWSVDEAALLLQRSGLTDFSIDAGGDVLCVGRPLDGSPRWRIGVRHPDRPQDAIGAVVEIERGAVATSGAYFRGDHIWGSGEGTLASVTVVGPQLGTADALATAAFADQAASLEWMASFPGYGLVVMTREGMLRWTADLEGMVVTPDRGVGAP
jgi:thiamine biosynthesis lipoprotein